MSEIERPWNQKRDEERAQVKRAAVKKQKKSTKRLWIIWGTIAGVILVATIIGLNQKPDPCYKARTSYSAYEIWTDSGMFDEASGYYSDYLRYNAECQAKG